MSRCGRVRTRPVQRVSSDVLFHGRIERVGNGFAPAQALSNVGGADVDSWNLDGSPHPGIHFLRCELFGQSGPKPVAIKWSAQHDDGFGQFNDVLPFPPSMEDQRLVSPDEEAEGLVCASRLMQFAKCVDRETWTGAIELQC